MIQKGTQIKINDNSGIKLGNCIKVYKKNNGTIGDKILISVRKLRLTKKKIIKINKIKKGDLFKAFIVHSVYKKKNTINNMIKFDLNCVIILNNQNKPIGTRVFGPITSKFREKKNFKLISLASKIL